MSPNTKFLLFGRCHRTSYSWPFCFVCYLYRCNGSKLRIHQR